MMKRRFFGIYGRVFFYTLAILLFAICITVIFFANQIGSVAEKAQQDQLANIFLPLSKELQGKSDEEAAGIAASFHAKNTSFEFSLTSREGNVIYQTDNYEQTPMNKNAQGIRSTLLQNQENPLQKELYKMTVGGSDGKIQLVMAISSGGRLYISGQLSGTEIYVEFIQKTAIALVLILLASIIGAALFARRIAGPIRKIAGDTKCMSKLQSVPAPKARKDEIGELAADVYSMYVTLKSTIAQLEAEIAREREMEENQRYFFSAASHELKTPIAAMSALVEEMLEGMVDEEDYPESLRKCMKMIAAQKKLISEILDIVRLTDEKVGLHNQEVRLREVTDIVLPMMKPLAEAKNIQLQVQITDELICRVDVKMLERVFSNIFMNAVQNTSPRGTVRIWAEENRDDEILFSVLNTGGRIDEEAMSKLFEPFFRLDKARSRGSGHSGLGLTIVKRTLDRMEIPFSLENTEEGVLFRMRLPKK